MVPGVKEAAVTLQSGDDLCQPFLVFGGVFRGRLVRLTQAASEILRRHDDPVPVATLLAEAMAAAVALAGGLKYDGVFTLQVQGDGPVHMLVTDVTSGGGVRACAKFDPDRLAAELRGRPDGFSPRLLGNGHLAFTVDQGPDTERYQGIVELTGGSLADSVHHYFRQSEQLASALKVAVGRQPTPDGDVWTAGAVLLQQMPEEGGENRPVMSADERDDAWRTAVILLGSLKDSELLDAGLSPERLLNRIYGTVGIKPLAPRPVRATCRCSAERSIRILASFPAAEIRNFATDDVVSMTCEFCREAYTFTLADVAAVADAAADPGKGKT
ncbi:MAG: molecular chaperone Hsp33 [Rhodospirillaceae bacterium]|nr:MAG: molecular chaperone Hsp33 [Rhodospirillaceae bacterium]